MKLVLVRDEMCFRTVHRGRSFVQWLQSVEPYSIQCQHCSVVGEWGGGTSTDGIDGRRREGGVGKLAYVKVCCSRQQQRKYVQFHIVGGIAELQAYVTVLHNGRAARVAR